MLYLIPTPIGNLQDITLRALTLLKDVDYVLSEDTRQSGKLFKHYEIQTPLRSFHSHNEHKKLDLIIRDLKQGIQIALISDAGTPGISDPGFLLIRACNEHDISYSVLPGATAFVPALIMSGFPTQHFYFEGFLPVKKGRVSRLEYLKTLNATIVLYESPHRILKALQQIADFWGSNQLVAVIKEISKIHENIFRGEVSDLISQFHSLPSIKGEFVIVIHGYNKMEKSEKEQYYK